MHHGHVLPCCSALCCWWARGCCRRYVCLETPRLACQPASSANGPLRGRPARMAHGRTHPPLSRLSTPQLYDAPRRTCVRALQARRPPGGPQPRASAPRRSVRACARFRQEQEAEEGLLLLGQARVLAPGPGKQAPTRRLLLAREPIGRCGQKAGTLTHCRQRSSGNRLRGRSLAVGVAREEPKLLLSPAPAPGPGQLPLTPQHSHRQHPCCSQHHRTSRFCWRRQRWWWWPERRRSRKRPQRPRSSRRRQQTQTRGSPRMRCCRSDRFPPPRQACPRWRRLRRPRRARSCSTSRLLALQPTTTALPSQRHPRRTGPPAEGSSSSRTQCCCSSQLGWTLWRNRGRPRPASARRSWRSWPARS